MKKGTKLVLVLVVLTMMVWVADPRSSFSQIAEVTQNGVICCSAHYSIPLEKHWAGATKCEYMRKKPEAVQAKVCKQIRASGKDCLEAAFFCPPEKKKASDANCEKLPPGYLTLRPWLDPNANCRKKGDIRAGKTQWVRSDAGYRCWMEYQICGYQEMKAVSATTSEQCRSYGENYYHPETYACCDDVGDVVKLYPTDDADNDTLPNHLDPYPFHHPTSEYTSNTPEANFPFWKDFKNALPEEPCTDCKWEFLDARQLGCRNVTTHARERTNEAQYKYQVKWKCPSTGREVIIDREVTLQGVYCPRSGGIRPE